MDKVISYAKQLFKQGIIQNLQIELDSDYLPKISFQLFSVKQKDNMPEKCFEFNIRCSNYRLCCYTNPITKEEEKLYVDYLGGEFIQRDLSRCCIYYMNKWSLVDFDQFRDLIDFLKQPSVNIKIPRNMRNLNKSYF